MTSKALAINTNLETILIVTNKVRVKFYLNIWYVNVAKHIVTSDLLILFFSNLAPIRVPNRYNSVDESVTWLYLV